jgi:hypothetical protein
MTMHHIQIATVLASVIILHGCATAQSATAPAVTVSCPPTVDYTLPFEQQVAKELGQLPQNSAVGVMIADYGRERAALRACAR